MEIKIKKDGLYITADYSDRKHLKSEQTEQGFDSDNFMYDLLEDLVNNSELEWVRAEEIGALTSAPILGIRDDNENVIRAWGFMDYQIISVQQRLIDEGKAVFIEG